MNESLDEIEDIYDQFIQSTLDVFLMAFEYNQDRKTFF